MAIYLFHGLAYSYLKGCTDLLRGIDTLSGSLLLILSCLLMTAAFSIPQLTTFTNAVSSLRPVSYTHLLLLKDCSNVICLSIPS